MVKARLAVESKMSEVLLEAHRRGLISEQPEPVAFEQFLADLEVPRRVWCVWGIEPWIGTPEEVR
jgi:hypothetical protein